MTMALCPARGTPIPDGARLCMSGGGPVAPVRASSPQEVRNVVTLVVADVTDPTDSDERLDSVLLGAQVEGRCLARARVLMPSAASGDQAGARGTNRGTRETWAASGDGAGARGTGRGTRETWAASGDINGVRWAEAWL